MLVKNFLATFLGLFFGRILGIPFISCIFGFQPSQKLFFIALPRLSVLILFLSPNLKKLTDYWINSLKLSTKDFAIIYRPVK